MAIVLGEGLLRIFFGANEPFCMYEPNISLERELSDGERQGCPQGLRYSTNQQGMRGDDYPDGASSYRILAMGGSTTICTYLDDAKTWPALVQKKLEKTADGRAVWVGNIGANGLTTRSHILQMLYCVPQYRVEAMLLLVGINDLVLRLWEHEKHDPNFMESPANRRALMQRIFSVMPDSMIHPAYKRFGFWKLARRTRAALHSHHRRNQTISDLMAWRQNRAQGHKITKSPDLTAALEEYVRNIANVVELAKQSNIRVITMTQPVLWHAGLPEENANLLFGFIGEPGLANGHAHYAVEILAECMKLYNEKLLQLCGQLGVECIDLAALLPQNTEVFCDDCHFTELGAELVADIVVEYFHKQHPVQAALYVAQHAAGE